MVFDGVQFTPLRKRAPPAVWHIATCHLQTVCLSEAPPTSPTFKPCELKACIENSNKRRAVEQAHDAAIWETWQLCLDGVSPNIQGTRNLDRPPQNTDSTSHLYWAIWADALPVLHAPTPAFADTCAFHVATAGDPASGPKAAAEARQLLQNEG